MQGWQKAPKWDNSPTRGDRAHDYSLRPASILRLNIVAMHMYPIGKCYGSDTPMPVGPACSGIVGYGAGPSYSYTEKFGCILLTRKLKT